MKRIYDSIHRFIRLDDAEMELIDTEPFQRLHFIHQLGIAFLVFPGGTHKRFEHSLGTMELATQIYDQILANSKDIPILPQSLDYHRKILRMAALCHDLGHLPFSHIAEKALISRGGHEAWTAKIIRETEVADVIREHLGSKALEDVIKIAIGEEKVKQIGLELPFTPWERLVSQMITGDFFGADRIDYLLRDARTSGLAYGNFDHDQLIETLRILSTDRGYELGIELGGIESCESLLLARYFMHKRIYQYPAVKGFAFHLSRFMKVFYQDHPMLHDLDSYIAMTDHEVLYDLRKCAKDPGHPAHLDAKALFAKKSRFRSYSLPSHMTPQGITNFINDLNLKEGEYFTEFVSKTHSLTSFDFPVYLPGGEIQPAHLFTEIAIPTEKKNWLYIHPEKKTGILERLVYNLQHAQKETHSS